MRSFSDLKVLYGPGSSEPLSEGKGVAADWAA